MGFPRQQLDGTTSLAILVPGEGIDPKRPRERSVSLGQIVGRLQKGVGHLDGFSEDLRNIAKPVKPLNYGAFGSYAPSYDSTFATITKDETHLMFNTYNNEGTSYLSESVMNVAKDYDYTFTMADNLLDLLTGGEHTRTTKLAEEQQKLTEENKTTNKCEIPAQSSEAMPVKVELEQLKTLSELGIDTSFLTEFEKMEEQLAFQNKLDEASVLLEKLQQVQTKRLSMPLPPHFSRIQQPSEVELQLVEKVTGSLTDLAKLVPPSDLVPVSSIRKAMGIDTPFATE